MTLFWGYGLYLHVVALFSQKRPTSLEQVVERALRNINTFLCLISVSTEKTTETSTRWCEFLTLCKILCLTQRKPR